VTYEWWIGSGRFFERAGVRRWEVMDVLYSSHRWPRAVTTPEGLPALTVWGRTDEGRPLVVLLRRLHPDLDTWQILLAAEMRPHQLTEYTAWEAER
jgi:hypothetical protein